MSKILIIEDSEDINALLSEALESAGFETESVYDGLVGKRGALSGRFDLIITDIMLPFLSGDEILCDLRKKAVCLS